MYIYGTLETVRKADERSDQLLAASQRQERTLEAGGNPLTDPEDLLAYYCGAPLRYRAIRESAECIDVQLTMVLDV